MITRIPKIIHYCWFGGSDIPDKIKKYIESWKRCLPDYQLMCWDESKFDISSLPYIKKAYDLKKYAFVSDYVRLYALKKYGGIYLDVDIEILKNFDDLLGHNAVFGFESREKVMTAFMACVPEHEIIKKFLEYYGELDFDENDMKPNTEILTHILSEQGLVINGEKQFLRDDMVVYPNTYFNAFDFAAYDYDITSSTYTVHHCLGSWCSPKKRLVSQGKKMLRVVLGHECYMKFKMLKKKVIK